MKDLGRKHSNEPEVAPSKVEHVSYPSFTLEGDQVKGTGLEKKKFGEECEIKAKIKVTRIGGYGDKEGSPSVGFDLIAIDTGYEEEEKGEKEEKAIGAKLPPSKKKSVSPSEAKMY